MSEYSTQPLSEDTQAEEQRRCALCFHFFPKDEMFHCQVDEAQNWQWVCEGCQEGIGGEA